MIEGAGGRMAAVAASLRRPNFPVAPAFSPGPNRPPLARRRSDGSTENEDMDRESVERLRFDRRLQSRRDWVEPTEVESHLESLPDVSTKMTTAAELEAEEEASRANVEAETANAPASEAAPEPAAPTFGGPTTVGGGGFGGDGTSFGG